MHICPINYKDMIDPSHIVHLRISIITTQELSTVYVLRNGVFRHVESHGPTSTWRGTPIQMHAHGRHAPHRTA